MWNRFLPFVLVLLLGTAAAARGQAPGKQLTPEDLRAWKTIRATSFTHDGQWFAYLVAPNEGDAEIVVRPTGPGAERRFAIGEPPTGGGFGGLSGALDVSEDGKWLAFVAYPTATEAKKLRQDRKPARNRVVVVNLATGTSREFPQTRGFRFAGEAPRWIAIQGYPAENGGGATARPTGGAASGTDLLLHQLGTEQVANIGNVGEYAFDDSGEWLALTIDARDRLGNAVQLRHLTNDATEIVESRSALYRRLAWADSGLALSLLRGTIDSAGKDTAYAVLGIQGIGRRATVTEYTAPSGDLVVSADRAPQWARDLSVLYFGMAPARAASGRRPDVRPMAGVPGAMQQTGNRGGATDDSLPSLVIWHGKDPRIQAMQQVQETRDKSFSFLWAYRPAEGRAIALATDSLRDVIAAPGDRWAIGSDTRPYERQASVDGVSRRVVWGVVVRPGARRRALVDQQFLAVPSPDGGKLLFYADGNYHVQDLATGTNRNITAGLPVSFVDAEDDHNRDRPPVFPVGWARGGTSVLLSDDWDVWNVPVDGGKAVNLTGNGRTERIRYQRRLVSDPRERGIDLAKPLYFQTYGEWTKKSGLARVHPKKPGAESLVFDDAAFGVVRARDVDAFVFTKQTFTQFPDWWFAAGTFTSPTRLTDANPQQKEFAWSPGSRLVNYVGDQGDTLQAALFLPAGYQPGRKYPTVTYIYEKLSQNLHQYATPNETRALNPSVYTSRGYAVLMPDIVYQINDPGMSAVWSVVPAVKAAIATGIVDPDNVGLHGHSWGGYQTAFLVTQTDIFKSAIAGAALTDMVSMYSSVYWNSGSANQPIFESSQGRFKGNFLDNYDAYIRNSPAFHAKNIKTPLLLLHNERDGAVDFNQGITFYNTLRELGKDVVLLQYVGENHGLAQPRNQKDYAVRMREFFDHYLTGVEAPDWLKNGIPRLEMEEHLKSRQPKPRVVP
ncbi:MAG: prolyl oligopeptidase family serine peptidase [Gemmatimonadales bacterium]